MIVWGVETKLRREHLRFVEIERLREYLAPYAENLMGENGVWVEDFEPGGFVVVSEEFRTEKGMRIASLSVGVEKRTYSDHPTWGRPEDEYLPTIRLNLEREELWIENDELMWTFFVGEPKKYRLLFRKTTAGLRVAVCERRFEETWEECDQDTSYLILTGLIDLLPRLNQRGD